MFVADDDKLLLARINLVRVTVTFAKTVLFLESSRVQDAPKVLVVELT